MMEIEDFIIPADMSAVEIMKKIDRNAKGVVYVCDLDRKLLGIITDGDLRRAIIRGGGLELCARSIMKTDPVTVAETACEQALYVMKKHLIRSVPIITESGELVGLRFGDDDGHLSVSEKKIDVPVVIMAGGKGIRLKPYTNILPKPLIPIGNKTITEHIMDRFVKAGCSRFDMIVNYKKNFIKAYFRDLNTPDTKITINFTDEDKYLGTAGGLQLLSGKYDEPFFMTNCDILIEEDYSRIMEYHREKRNLATIVCAVKNTTLPYGVVKTTQDGRISAIEEKPDISSIVNTGFYVLEPDFIERIPKETESQITDIFQACIDDGLQIGMYPVSEERWMDMGQMDELHKMTERLGGIG